MKGALVLAAGALLATGANAAPGKPTLQTRAEFSMGTVFTLSLQAQALPDPRAAARQVDKLFAGAFAIIRAHDKALSDYDPTSELNRVQPLARRGPTAVSPLLCHAIAESVRFGDLSSGAFDITVGPLVRLWGFKDRHFQVPGQAAISRQLRAGGLDKISLSRDSSGCRLALGTPGTALDFGGIGKGLALDAGATWLRGQGVRVAALDAGGSSMVFMGAPEASPRGWPVLLRDGSRLLWLKDRALASSGDDQQFFVQNGIRYGHILDPRSGWPVPARAGVTVIGRDATSTDALSTALMVLPHDQGDRLADLLDAEVIRSPIQQEQPPEAS
ncbi:MAG: FAD:protein FMN transferase [Candidatus Sericytochromatia bacterium]